MRISATGAGAALAFSLLLATAATAMEWTGRVVDARTGTPLAGVRVHGGHPGRGGIGAMVTAADGRFRVKYPEGYDQNPGQYEYYALTVEPQAVVEQDEWDTKPDVIGEHVYQDYVAHYKRPQGVGDVRVVPRYALVKGKITDASTGKAIAGARMTAFRPGAAIHSTTTDGNGVYRLRIDAYQGWHTSIETTPKANRPPEADGWYQPLEQIGMEAEAQGYSIVQVNPVEEGAKRVKMRLPFTSTATSALFTGVDMRLPKRGGSFSANMVKVTAPGAPAAAGGGEVDLKAVVKDLNLLIAQHRQVVMKARADGKLPCNQQLLDEMKRIRVLLEGMGGKSQGYKVGEM